MPGTDDLMAGYSNSIGGLMADHNSMVSGLMANYNAGGGSGGGIMAGPAFTPGPGVSYGPGPMNNTGRWTPNGLPGSSWDNPFGSGFQMPTMGGLMQQPPMQQPMMPQEQQPMQQPMEQGYDENGFRRSDGRRKVRGYSNPAARPTNLGTMPFGGFRAKGGPVSPGRKYVVGEQGPEMFVPQRPGTIIPMAQRDYINLDRASQMNAEKGMDEMSMRPGGRRFTGPMMPSPPNLRLMEAQKQNAIAGQNQRELAAKFNPPVPQAMPMMPADPRRSGPLSGRSQFGAQSGPLSMRGPMPVGRSANDPNRIAEQMRRRGDPRAIMQLGMQQQGMDFARERDATNFQQGLMMNGMQQAAMAQRDATNFQQGLTMFDAQQQAMGQRDATNFQQQQQMNEQQRLQQQQDEAARRQFGLKPVPVTGTSTPFFQDAKGSIHAGGEMPRPEAPLPPGLVPKSAERGGVRYGVPAVEKPVAVKAPTLKQIYEGDVPQNVQWNEQRNRWERVKIYNPGDPDDNGVPGDQRAGAATATTAPAAGAAAPAAAPRKTGGGVNVVRIQ